MSNSEVNTMDTTNANEDVNEKNISLSNSMGKLQGAKVVVDATHPRFLFDAEKSPQNVSAATEENFCRQCQMVFANSPEAVRDHFKIIFHKSTITCTYCSGDVFEYFFGNERKFAHDCNYKTKK